MALPLAWLAGVALQLQERELWLPRSAYLAITGCGGRRGSGAGERTVAAGVRAAGRRGGWAAGFALAGIQASLRLGTRTLPAARWRGATSSSPASSPTCRNRVPSGLRFRFEVDPGGGAPAGGVPSVIALGWYAGFHEDAALVQPRLALRAGQRWRFTVRLRQPHGNLNPHGFDYELALLEQGVRSQSRA